ncbi:Uncharacterised protein [uncultured archaeon]|nr:Uncharacterised protein [uncultured archaeon]
MTTYISFAAYIIPEMSKVAGFGECELRRIVQKFQSGGAVRVMDNEGSETIVRVERIEPARFGSDAFCY